MDTAARAAVSDIDIDIEAFLDVDRRPQSDYARRTLRELENVRAALIAAAWHEQKPTAEKLRVVQFASGAELHQFASPSIDAFYQPVTLNAINVTGATLDSYSARPPAASALFSSSPNEAEEERFMRTKTVVGWGFALASPITIDRQAGHDAMQQMIQQGRARLAQGFWIVIYPEGTRIRAGTRARYKTGGARLAIGLPAPVLPVAHNAGYLWPKGLFGKKPGTITLSIGPSISPDGKDAAQLTQEIESWIEGEVARLGVPA